MGVSCLKEGGASVGCGLPRYVVAESYFLLRCSTKKYKMSVFGKLAVPHMTQNSKNVAN